MDRRLTPGLPSRRRGVRRAAFAALVVAVALLHVSVAQRVAASLAEAAAAQKMPARIVVAYVRTLELEAPRAAAAPVPVPQARLHSRAPHRQAHRPKPVSAGASAALAAASAASAVAAAAAASASRAEADAASASLASAALAASEPASAAIDAAASAASSTELTPIAMADAAQASATAASEAAAASAANLAAVAASSAAASAVSIASAASAVAGDTFVWPSATRVSYILTGNYRGPIVGRAAVEWIRVGDRYQVNVDLHAGPDFAPIFSRHMRSEGRLGADGLEPDRYDEETQLLMRAPRLQTVLFGDDSVTLGDGQKRERLPGVQDTASQFIQFTWLFGSRPGLLHVGASFVFPLALPHSMKAWTYDVTDESTLFTRFGELPVFHLKPRIVERRANELAVEMWFAPELRYLPVRIRIEQNDSTWVDLVIDRKPEIAAS